MKLVARLWRAIQRWLVTTTVFTIVMALLLGGSYLAAVQLLPDNDQQNVAQVTLAVSLAVVAANVIVAVMQLFGISPADLLPPQTLEERLKKENSNRYLTSKSTDSKFLYEQAKAAKNNKEYNWMYLFANAWVKLKPHEPDALELLSDAYFELELYEEAINFAYRLIEREKLNYRGYSNLGKAYFQVGDLENARRYMEEALSLSDATQRQFSLIDLIRVYEAQGDVEKAIATVEEVMPLLDSEFQRDFYGQKLDRFKRVFQNRQNVIGAD